MSTVDDKTPLGRAIHQEFHLLALKHKIDVDKVAEIVEDWDAWKRTNLVQKAVRKERSKTGAYSAIIEVLVPVRFYWTNADRFDGIEIGPCERGFTRHESRLLDRVLDVIHGRIAEGGDAKDEVPKAILKAFEEEED